MGRVFSTEDLKKLNLIEYAPGKYKPSGKVDREKFEVKDELPSKQLVIEVEKVHSPNVLRKVTLNLFGEPMPKQSVRSFIQGGAIKHYQPKETIDRTNEYIKTIKFQLPKDFVMFEQRVHVRKMHFVFKPLKAFHKIKGRMKAINEGEIIYKETRPDLPDNLKKLVNDAMSGLVYKDDGIIVSEDNVKKYYGEGGMIIIELEGY